MQNGLYSIEYIHSFLIDPPTIEGLELTGGPFHTAPLSVSYHFVGGTEGDTSFLWQKSIITTDSKEVNFKTIVGAKKRQYYPSIDDAGQEVRVIVTPVRDDWVEGRPVTSNSIWVLLGII